MKQSKVQTLIRRNIKVTIVTDFRYLPMIEKLNYTDKTVLGYFLELLEDDNTKDEFEGHMRTALMMLSSLSEKHKQSRLELLKQKNRRYTFVYKAQLSGTKTFELGKDVVLLGTYEYSSPCEKEVDGTDILELNSDSIQDLDYIWDNILHLSEIFIVKDNKIYGTLFETRGDSVLTLDELKNLASKYEVLLIYYKKQQ